MVAPSPRTRRPPPRPQPRGLPPSAGRRPPPAYSYGPPHGHGGRRLLVLVLVLTTLGAVGYLYLSRNGGNSSASGFAGANQASVKATKTVITASQHVQRFAELHTFDLAATAQNQELGRQLTKLQSISAGASGKQKQIADEEITTVQQAMDAIGRYRNAVAFTYRLADAELARQDLDNAIASLNQQAQAWQHA